MLTNAEQKRAADLSEAISRGDNGAVEAILETLKAKEWPTVFDYLLTVKASRFLSLSAESDLAEYQFQIELMKERVQYAARPIEEINQEKAEDPFPFDEARAAAVLSAMQQICELATDESDEQGWGAFRMQAMHCLAVLAAEYERVAANVDPLAHLEALRDLVAKNTIVVGAWEAEILSKYALHGPVKDEDAERIRTWVDRHRLSEQWRDKMR